MCDSSLQVDFLGYLSLQRQLSLVQPSKQEAVQGADITVVFPIDVILKKDIATAWKPDKRSGGSLTTTNCEGRRNRLCQTQYP